MSRLVLAAALAGLATGAACGHAPAPPPAPPPKPVAPPAPVAPPELAVAEAGVADLGADSAATLVGLRKQLAARGFTVKPDNNGGSLVFDVFRDADQLFYVVPTDDGRLFNLHVTTTKIASAAHGWRVGGSLSDLGGMSCECWGGQGDEVTTCFHPGEHVAVVYERACAGMRFEDDRNRKVLQGATIARLVWQPGPWTVDAAPPAAAPAD